MFYTLERVQDGKSSHTVVFQGGTKDDATEKVLDQLRDFVTDQLYASDEEGRRIDDQS